MELHLPSLINSQAASALTKGLVLDPLARSNTSSGAARILLRKYGS